MKYKSILLIVFIIVLSRYTIVYMNNLFIETKLVNSIYQLDQSSFDSIIKNHGCNIKLHPWCSAEYMYPVHMVCSRGNKEMLDFLIDNDCDLTVKAGDGRTCAFIMLTAISPEDSDSYEMLRLILNSEPSLVSTIDEESGLYLLHAACEYVCDLHTISILLESGASPTLRDAHGRTPLDIVKTKQNVRNRKAIVSLLQRHIEVK